MRYRVQDVRRLHARWYTLRGRTIITTIITVFIRRKRPVRPRVVVKHRIRVFPVHTDPCNVRLRCVVRTHGVHAPTRRVYGFIAFPSCVYAIVETTLPDAPRRRRSSVRTDRFTSTVSGSRRGEREKKTEG